MIEAESFSTFRLFLSSYLLTHNPLSVIMILRLRDDRKKKEGKQYEIQQKDE